MGTERVEARESTTTEQGTPPVPIEKGPPGSIPDRVIDLAALERERDQRVESTAGVVSPSAALSRPWSVDELDVTTSPRPGRGVSRGLLVVATMSVVAVVVLAVVATVSYRNGTRWRELALTERARGEALEERVEAAARTVAASQVAVRDAERARDEIQDSLEAATGQLDTSETDVAALEARVAALAGEKARLEDEIAVAGHAVQADIQGIAAVRQCVGAIDAWLTRAPTDGQVASWQLWAEQSSQWEVGCDAALGAAGR